VAIQCKNGHIACSSCCIKLGNTCPSCCYHIGDIRCRAIENVLESAKISCRNTKYGCKEAVGYSKQNDHEKTCIYAPCSCPLFLGCNFVASSKQLYKHFRRKHPTSATSFLYNCVFSVSLNVKGQFVVLQEQNDDALFVLNNRDEHLGNLVTVCCIGPCSSTRGFPFTLEAKIHGSSVRLRSLTKNSQNWLEEPPSTGFLLIPSGFYGSCDQIKLDVCIQRNAAC
jgi:E3 ubiquitin-protein ligase SIAH1